MERRNKTMLAICLFALYVILASSGLVLFKLGSTSNAFIKVLNFSINFSWKMLLGIFCYGFSFLIWLYIVSKMNLTLAMPLSVALVNTLVIVESCLILKEKITLTQGIGILIVIVGVIIMTLGKSK